VRILFGAWTVTRPRFVSFREFVKIRDPVQARRGYGRTICVGDSVPMAARPVARISL